MKESIYVWLVWIVAAGILGFAVSTVFSRMLRLSRRIFLVSYVVLGGGLVYAFFTWSGVDFITQIVQNWLWGSVAVLVLTAFVVKNVLSQPASARSEGLPLVLDLLWAGVVYGSVDALLLSVLPVLATWQAFSQSSWTGTWLDQVVIGILAMLASLLVTAAYHLGYAEYNGPPIAAPLLGMAS